MGRRRRRRTRSDTGGRRTNVETGVEAGFPTFEHNQWTFEGEIERLGAFSRGATNARGWKRVTAIALAVIFLVPFAISVGVWLLRVVAEAL